MKSGGNNKSNGMRARRRQPGQAFGPTPRQGHSVPLSTIALAVALMATLPPQARAANECGAEAAGADSITCSGPSYPAGIWYAGSDGLTLNLNNPAMVVQGGGPATVSLQGAAGNTNNLTVNATSLTSITGVNRPAISVANLGDGMGSITMDGGSVSANLNSVLSVTNLSGSGSAQITINGGLVSNTANSFLTPALNATIGGTATGNATVTITGGAVESLGTAAVQGVRSHISNTSSSATATINLSGGSVTARNTGLVSQNSGLGEAVITMTGGTVTTTGGGGRGLHAIINNAASSANVRVAMQGGSVTTQAGSAPGIYGQNRGTGQVLIDMSGGTISAPGNNSDGILAQSTGGSYAVNVTGGTVSGGAGFAAGIHTAGAAGGTLNIGAGAVINAGGSGIAIRDGDLNFDGTDEIGGNAVITTAGTVNGNVLLGGGTDSMTITGGAINGDITGDGPDTLALNMGAGSFTYGAGGTISAMSSVTMNSGTAQIDGAIAGATPIVVNDGRLVLTGANGYSGGTFLNGGMLSVASDANLGDAAGGLSFNGGTLQTTAAFGSARSVTLGAGGGTFQADADLALSSAINGTGALTKTGAGALALSAANTYTGSTTIAAGTLALTGAGSIASSSKVVADGSFDISGLSAAGTSIQRLAGSGNVALGAKTLTVSAANDTFSGVIAGSGGLAVTGGIQTLSGTNTYTGGTTVSAGTLQIGNGGSSGSIMGDVTNNGTLAFNRSGASTFAGAISGAGTIRQLGAGATRLTGNSAAFTGTTTVEAGMLSVNGTLGGTLNVLGAGRLQGSGTVGSTTVAGTIAPGNSIGTLNINGSFTQAAGSTYQVEVDPASNASDLIHATGSASIASGANLQVLRTSSTGYGLGNRYTVLTADGGVTGTYSLTGDTQTAFVRLFDSYDATHVYLNTEKVRSFTEAAASPNQAAVATALESLPDDNGLVNAVAFLPSDFAARDAFNQLSVDIHASSKTAALEDSRFVREAAIDRLRTAACAPGSAAATPQQQQQQQQAGAGCITAGAERVTWGQVFGSWGHIDGTANAAKLKRDIGGFVVGADTSVGAGWRVGGLAGYSRASADTDARNSSAKTDSYHLGVYGATQWGATALRLGASQSWNKLDTSRSVAFAGFADSVSAQYDSTTSQVFGEVGHRIDAGRVALEPFAGLAHVRVKTDAFFERGGLAALHGAGDSTDATFSTLGVRASTQLSDSTRVRGLLGWRHAFGDTTPTSTHAFGGSLPFTLAGVPLAKNVAVLEAGVETQLRPNLTLGASYAGQFGDGLQDHGFKVNLNWAF
ncbi:autotransporter domain-containing protein [Variovorax paradoxus]|nr:autotransporter domain-containing protein [Variovorax paradoxus]